jgi:hypothetical protein
VVVGAVVLPELDDACTVPVGETCTDKMLLEDVVIGGEAVEDPEPKEKPVLVAEVLAVVCGRANAGAPARSSIQSFSHASRRKP